MHDWTRIWLRRDRKAVDRALRATFPQCRRRMALPSGKVSWHHRSPHANVPLTDLMQRARWRQREAGCDLQEAMEWLLRLSPAELQTAWCLMKLA